MVWEPTENHWCTKHFYSTRLWEPRGISSLSARVNSPHTQNTIFLPLQFNRFHFHAEKDCRLMFIESCILREFFLKCVISKAWFHALAVLFLYKNAVFTGVRNCVFIHYSGAWKFWLFLELLQYPSKGRKRKMVQHKFS